MDDHHSAAPHDEIPAAFGNKPPSPPSPQAQSWGVVISIAIIVLMIIIGAYYSWNRRTSSLPPVAVPVTAP